MFDTSLQKWLVARESEFCTALRPQQIFLLAPCTFIPVLEQHFLHPLVPLFWLSRHSWTDCVWLQTAAANSKNCKNFSLYDFSLII